MYVPQHAHRGKRATSRSQFSTSDSRDQSPAIILGSKCSYPLNNPASHTLCSYSVLQGERVK